jgi:hypothetical protein
LDDTHAVCREIFLLHMSNVHVFGNRNYEKISLRGSVFRGLVQQLYFPKSNNDFGKYTMLTSLRVILLERKYIHLDRNP